MSMFPILNFDQANPGLTGAKRISDIFESILGNQSKAITNRFMPRTIHEALREKQLANDLAQGTLQPNIEAGQMLPQKTMADILNTQGKTAKEAEDTKWVGPTAQANIAKIMQGDIPESQAKTRYTNIQSMLYPEKTRANINSVNADVRQKDILANAFNDVLGANNQQQGSQPQQMQFPQAQPQQNMQSQSAQQLNQPMSREDKMLKLGNLINIMNNKAPLEAEGIAKAREKTAVLEAEDLHNKSNEYIKGAKDMDAPLRELQNFKRAIDKMPRGMAGSTIPKWTKNLFNSPGYQEAQKAASNLLMSELRPMLQGLGQAKVVEIENIAKGLPNADMSIEAMKTISEELESAFLAKQKQGQIANKLKNIRGATASDIDAVVGLASKFASPISDKGVNNKSLDEWMKFATPEAIMAARNGQDYLPPDIKPSSLNPSIVKIGKDGKKYVRINNEWVEYNGVD